jgi:Putative methyltransferase
VTRDWIAWHRGYDDPESSLGRRLREVQSSIGQAVRQIDAVERPAELRVISLCAGDGRDLLPVLANHREVRARALLIELDLRLAEAARRRAEQLTLAGVEVRCADAGDTAACAGVAPAHLVLACGVFGNITADDGRRTVTALRHLTSPGGFVIWTRGRGTTRDPSTDIRAKFSSEGFVERAFIAPEDAQFRVGVEQLSPASALPYRRSIKMFSFAEPAGRTCG